MKTIKPVQTTALSAAAIAIAKGRHYPYSEDRAGSFWGLALQRLGVPTAFTWGYRDVPTEVGEQLATRITHREQSGQVIDYQGRQYFAAYHHTAEHCALISDCFRRNEPYLSLVIVKHLELPDRRG